MSNKHSINQAIVEKLGLKTSDVAFSSSFMHNVVVYEYLDGIYCASADTDGYPASNKLILFFKDGNHMKLSEELLIDIPVEEIRKLTSRLSAVKPIVS